MNIYIFIGLILMIILSVLIYLSNKLCLKIVYPRKKTYENGYENQIKRLSIDTFYNSLIKEDIYINSPYGYKLKGIFINNNNSKKCVILCHGITANINYSVKYIKPFYDRGYSIFLYDHRNHGFSGGNYTSMGYFEKFDLKACANWIFNRLGNDTYLGVLGESMGAGTVMMYCGIDKRVKFCIEDCGYSNLFELFKHILLRDYHINFPPIIYIADLIMKFKYGWGFKKTSPIHFVKNLSLPMLFIHGDEDDYVPTKMVYELYLAKTNGFKELYVAKNAVHADALLSNAEKYDEVIGNFLNRITLN